MLIKSYALLCYYVQIRTYHIYQFIFCNNRLFFIVLSLLYIYFFFFYIYLRHVKTNSWHSNSIRANSTYDNNSLRVASPTYSDLTVKYTIIVFNGIKWEILSNKMRRLKAIYRKTGTIHCSLRIFLSYLFV